MNTTHKPVAIAKLQAVTRFNTILWALMQQGYQESRSRLDYEENRRYLHDRLLVGRRSSFTPARVSPQLPVQR